MNMTITRTVLLISIILTISLQSCKKDTKNTETVIPTETEDVYVDDPFDLIDENGDSIIIGTQKRSTLEREPYNRWFDISYKEHTLDTLTINTIKEQLAQTHITLFMGTWCEDSQRETPAFFKILDLAGIDASTIQLITVNEDKDQPEELVAGKDITNVPTIIFQKDGQELGRIVEYPIESLEKDMQKILNGEEYKHAYTD